MDGTGELQRGQVVSAMVGARLSVDDLWIRYFGLGGTADPSEVDAFLSGLADLGPPQRDVLAQAVNERLDELHRVPRAAFSRDVRTSTPDEGPLGALVRLLTGAHLAPPDQVPDILRVAARAMDVEAVLYLADYGVVELVPFTGSRESGRRGLDIDGTVAGRAFRRMRTQVGSRDGAQDRLWVPVLDGVERLGVLEIVLVPGQDATDPALQEQCWWLAHYAGHLVTAMAEYGDAVDAVRRRRPRTQAAELVWQLLPPLTAGTERIVVSGRVEPSASAGGDVFDYALADDVAHLAVIDATGHDLKAGLTAATCLAAYRNARRQGRPLFDQAESVHRAVADQFDAETFATGVLAEVDLRTGRLRYVAAGHPYPLLLRDGRVVRTLTDGRRSMFGIDPSEVTLGEEQLEPGDRLVLYTDGVTEARDAHGRHFGVDGLTDVLTRESASGTPMPEVVRRVTRAILARAGSGGVRDDATILLAQWAGGAHEDLAPPPLQGRHRV